MKILFWTPFFLPDIGGIETFISKALPRLKQRDCDFIVVTSHGKYDLPDETEYEGISIYRFHFREALGKGNLREIIKIKQKIARLKQSFKPDLIHMNISDPSAFFHISTESAYPVPMLATFHSHLSFHDPAGAQDSLLAKIIDMADWVSVVSEDVLTAISKVRPDIKDRSTVIYYGIDLPDIIPEPLSFESPRIICIGRLIRKKGFDLAIEAFGSLHDRFPQARLIIIGDGPLRSELEQQAVALNLSEAIEFNGQVIPEKVYLLMNTASVIVIPSRLVQENSSHGFTYSEGFPMVALEASMIGRPVVATSVGGLSEIIVHKQTGLIVEQENSRSLTDAIAYLITNKEKAVRMGRNGRTRVVETFRLEKCIDSYYSLYHNLIGKTNHK